MKHAILISLLGLGCTHPHPAPPLSHTSARDPDTDAIDRAMAALAQPDCGSFAVEERTASYTVVAMREIHDARCPGDPNVWPVVHRVRVATSGTVELYDAASDTWLPAPTGARSYRVTGVAFAGITAVDQRTANARIGRTLALGATMLTYAGDACAIRTRETVATADVFADVALTAQQRAGVEPTATLLTTDCNDEASEVYVTSRAAFLIRDGVVYVLAPR